MPKNEIFPYPNKVSNRRDRDRREVDFLIVKNQQPWCLVECKMAETSPTENLKYFSNRLNVPAVQVVLKKGVFRQEGRILVVSADRWLPLFP